jgi:DNA polymerase-4
MDIDTSNILRKDWAGRAFLLVDLDAFFASVEQLDHPQWRGKPVIVGGKTNDRGVVSTCSYEARAYGVHSAMPSATARRLCPDAIWASPHFDRYRELSHAVMDIMYDESPLLEQVSIDEAFLDVTPGRFIGDAPVEIAARIQERVAKLGITCSIGIATSKVVAKIASDMDKPRGLTVVYPGSEVAFLAPMQVRTMPGIGRQSAEKLGHLGIRTIRDLADASTEDLRPVFGINAETMHNRALGIDDREIITEHTARSLGHERTFSTDLTLRAQIENALDYLGSLVGRRLRRKGLTGHTVTLKLRYADLSFRTAQRTLAANVDNEAIFIPIAKALIDEIWQPGDHVRLVGISISEFEAHDEQLDLFKSTNTDQGNHMVVDATDKVRDKYGENAIRFGREFKIDTHDVGAHRTDSENR